MTELTDRGRDLLRERHFGVLATINYDGSPQLTTMWYELLDSDIVLMNTKVGRFKLDNMMRDHRVSLCVQRGYQYVTVSGTVQIIDDSVIAQRDICRLATRYDGEESAHRQMRDRFSKEQRVTLLLKCEHFIEYFSQ